MNDKQFEERQQEFLDMLPNLETMLKHIQAAMQVCVTSNIEDAIVALRDELDELYEAVTDDDEYDYEEDEDYDYDDE